MKPMILVMAFGLLATITGGCQNSLPNRSLIFFTGTTLGVEVAVNPSDATGPARVVIGYKRGEGVLNPVYHSDGVESPATETTRNADGSSTTGPAAGATPLVKRYRDQAYSVIAKFSGEGVGGTGNTAQGKISVAQWFATGEAAETLARQPAIAGAVTGSAEIAKEAAAAQRALGKGAEGLSLTHAMAFLQSVSNGLSALAGPADGSTPDRTAQRHVTALQELAREAAPGVWLRYQWNDLANKKIESTAEPVQPDLAGIAAYIASADGSNAILAEALKTNGLTFKSFRDAAFLPVAIGSQDHARLQGELEAARALLKGVRSRVASDPRALAAVDYYLNVVTGSN